MKTHKQRIDELERRIAELENPVMWRNTGSVTSVCKVTPHPDWGVSPMAKLIAKINSGTIKLPVTDELLRREFLEWPAGVDILALGMNEPGAKVLGKYGKDYVICSDGSKVVVGRAYSMVYDGSPINTDVVSNIGVSSGDRLWFRAGRLLFMCDTAAGAKELEQPAPALKPAYEILAFRATENTVLPGSIHWVMEHTDIQIEYLDKPAKYEIFRVRRTSDGSVWEVGQSVQAKTAATKIKRFEILNDNIFAYGENEYVGVLSNWSPAPDWEVVEFDGGWSDGAGPFSDQQYKDWMALVADGIATIKSVRRKDGQAFRVGDRVTNEVTGNLVHTIGSFHIKDGNLLVDESPQTITDMPIGSIAHATPLFRAADGVEVYEGDTVWCWSDGVIKSRGATRSLLASNWFSTSAAANASRRTTHTLKTLTTYYAAVANGSKTFELRKNDRDFKVGDTLHLIEWHEDHATGTEMQVEVTYILNGPIFGLAEGYCVMGIKLVA